MADLRTHRELTERGEAAIVSALMGLSPSYVILPHLLLPGMLGPRNPDDLDVVVLGPAGAALLEYRHWHGQLEVHEGAQWTLHFAGGGREQRPNPVASLRQKAEALLDHMRAHGMEPPAFVMAVVVPDRSRVEGEATVPVIPASRVARWIDDALLGDGATSRPPDVLKLNALANWTLRAADLLRPPSAPRMINQYRLTNLLSRHGDQAAYLAYDTLKERLVTLLELPYDPYQRPDDLERTRTELLREAKLTMELQHPAIARVEQVIPQDDCYYVVREWIDGAMSLREQLAQGPMAVENALDMAIACADALSYAHSLGIVHRDVRPENLLVAGRLIKLAGFKMAKKADIATRSTFDLRQMAQENPYVAPEFRLGAEGPHRVDARADIYALGAVLYEAVTGSPPVHLDEKYWTPPSTANSHVSQDLDEVIQQALRFDPTQRFSTMAALRERLLIVREGRPRDARSARYTERKLVKRTRNSILFRALDVETNQEVALKKLSLDGVFTLEARQVTCQRLLREAQIARSLVHPRIVTVLDAFIEDDDPYVVMEWLEGHDLREHLDGSRPLLSCEDAFEIVRQVGDALLYAHSLGVVHRDIKPENIMLSGMRATILDFGLATLGPVPEEANVGGTPRYMAPEALRGGAVDARADVFSLAVVLYELLTARYPYGADVIMGRFDPGRNSEAVAPPSHLNLAVPPAVDAPILRALAIDPERRPARMEEFLSELSSAQDGPVPGGFLPQGRLPWKALLMGGSGAVVVGGLAIGVYLSGPGLFHGTQFSRLPSPGPTVSASPSPLPTPEATPSMVAAFASAPPPSPLPSASSEPVATEPPSISWVSASTAIQGVTIRIERLETDANGATVTLKIANASNEAVSFLDATVLPDAVVISDDSGQDFTSSLDWSSVPADLTRIEAGQTSQGAFRLTRSLSPRTEMIQMVLKEIGGGGREFLLRAHRVEGH